MDYDTLSDDSQAKSFFLYSKPADQLHENRDLVSYKDPSGNTLRTQDGKMKPVMIHAGNIDQWQSIEILEKKVTISDQQLGALSLGHLVAQSLTRDQIANKLPDVDTVIQQADKSIIE